MSHFCFFFQRGTGDGGTVVTTDEERVPGMSWTHGEWELCGGGLT